MKKPNITEGEWIPTIYSNKQIAVTTDESGQVCEFNASHKITPDAQAISAVPEMIGALSMVWLELESKEDWGEDLSSSQIHQIHKALQKAGVEL